VPSGKDTQFKIRYALCIDCHKDEHEGQFSNAPWNNRCEKCHNGSTFKITSFTLAMHQKSNFRLDGGHIAVPCLECHKQTGGTKVTPYHFSELTCATCHEDVHHGQFAGKMSGKDSAGRVLGCQACHSTKEWKDLAKFNHDASRFPLNGSHRAVRCADCHKPPNLELTMRHVDFSKTPGKCGDCHENPHADQFGDRKGKCETCHNTNKWKPSLFDHDATGFPLKGGHENVACSACHTIKRNVNSSEVLFYKPTSKNCDACHGASIPKARTASS
jgi:nitrate/TMAO reductase-like tetraheme cytochrome c subunit